MKNLHEDVFIDTALTRRVSGAIVAVAIIIMISAYVLTSRYIPERPPMAPQLVTLPPVPAQLSELRADKSPPISSIDVIQVPPAGARTVASDARPVVSAQRTATIQIVGWAIDRNATRPAGAIFLESDGKTLIAGQYGLPRPDVAANFKNPALQAVGFLFSFSAGELRIGDHAIDLVVVGATGKTYYRAKDRIRLDVR